MVREMIEELVESHPEIDVVGSVDFGAALALEVDRTRATIVVLADGEDQICPRCQDLLLARPHVTALAVVDHGRENFLCELQAHRIPLGPLLPKTLIGLLRPQHGPRSETS
jgi:hypothetical protein